MSDSPQPSSTAVETTLHQPAPGEATVSRLSALEVTVLEGPEAGQCFKLHGERFTLGRDAPHDIVLSDNAVSASHLELRITAAGVQLRDLGSTNGTWLGRGRIDSAILSDGAEFIAGDTRLRLRQAEQTPVAASQAPHFHELLGGSEPMRILFAKLARLASTPLSVLVLGETGTGKELIARALHNHAKRRGNFVVLDCTTLPRELAESIILGHKRGTFTGALSDRKGCFEEADGGTLFIDEIGDLAPDLQPKLLRVLERREVCRLGETKARPVDVRVIAATHRDLRGMISTNEFRLDLFQRLAQVEVLVPALRERPEDIEALVAAFLRQVSAATDIEYDLEPAALVRLQSHHWEGNVRELKNTIERVAYMSQGPKISVADLTLGRGGGPAAGGAGEGTTALMTLPLKLACENLTERFQRRYCLNVLEQCDGDIDAAAAQAGYGRRGFVELLKRLKLNKHG